MASRQQDWRICLAGLVASNHVANRVGLDLIKTTTAHGRRDAVGAGAVCLGQVGDGELPLFLVARITELRQLFMPVPYLVAKQGRDVELVVQANFGNAMDVAQAFRELKLGMALQTALEGVDDFLSGQPGSARSTHGEDERKTKFSLVSRIETLDFCQFIWAALRQADLALLQAGLGC